MNGQMDLTQWLPRLLLLGALALYAYIILIVLSVFVGLGLDRGNPFLSVVSGLLGIVVMLAAGALPIVVYRRVPLLRQLW